MKKNQLLRNRLRALTLGCSVVCIALFSSCENDNGVKPTLSKNTSTKHSSARGAGQGTDAGYFWTLWSGGGGTSDISFPQSSTYPGNFQISYTNDACVGGKGWATGTNSRVINYNVGWLQGSYDFIGVYGWVQNPLIEYYVCEKGYAPWSFDNTGYELGPVVVDGRTYRFARHQQVNKPSIEGTSSTFWQYMDNWGGQDFTKGNQKISMAGHINNWKRYGGKGWGTTHNYQVFAIEAFGGKTGLINATVW